MSEYENIFIATAEKPSQFSRLLVDRFEFEYMRGMDPQTSEDLGLRCRALTADGFVGLRLYANTHVDPNAGTDEVQAFDAYPLQINCWIPRPRPVEAQEAELGRGTGGCWLRGRTCRCCWSTTLIRCTRPICQTGLCAPSHRVHRLMSRASPHGCLG
jgi:hypothetical protein